MFRRNNKTRKYQAPAALVTHMALESNFCQTVRFQIKVQDLDNMNDPETNANISAEYFEDIIS